MKNTPKTTEAEPTSRRGWYWPWLLAGLLVMALAANGILLLVATGDPSFTIIDDYYQKALDWDAQMAQAEHNAELGWLLEVKPPVRVGPNRVLLSVELSDERGEPLADVSGSLRAYRLNRAREVHQLDLERAPDGSFRTLLPVAKGGLYEISIKLERGSDRYTYKEHLELP